MHSQSLSAYLATLAALGMLLTAIRAQAPDTGLTYPIVDTGQDRCYSNAAPTDYPKQGRAFFGQDAQYVGNQPGYKDNGDGTVTDVVTGLIWQKDPGDKKTFAEAVAGAKGFRLAGHDDWRLPPIKELYSLIDFRGYSMATGEESVPYLNTDYFVFRHGDVSAGERVMDAQYWSSTQYVSTTMGGNATVFGVNFADGRIKGYPRDRGPGGQPMREFVLYVRGNPRYGVNDFVDNGDGTLTDRATGLMWAERDSAKPMSWEQALAYAENLTLGGQGDWRLPNAKELQSVVDYTRSPTVADQVKRGPAIAPIFETTEAESWCWTSTTHLEHNMSGAAVYVCFGQAFGYMGPAAWKQRMDVHGAGAQRSDPKAGDPAQFPTGRGPQGDEIRIYNYVRCVRGGAAKLRTEPPTADRSKYPYNVAATTPGNHAGPLPPFGPPGRPGFVRRLDRDADGKVSREEFDGPPEHFDVLDRDHDGFLSEEEAPHRPPPPPGPAGW
jgi:hypothetical protein